MRFANLRQLGPALVLLLAAGCASAPASTIDSSLAPSMVLERFLRASNSNDLDTMARLFGGREGTLDTSMSKKDLDERLFAIASVIRHTDYQILGEQIVPGRREEATRFMVRLQMGDGRYEVPFIMVQSRKQGWLVEYVPVLEISNRRGGGSR